jgi:hypothetical protein
LSVEGGTTVSTVCIGRQYSTSFDSVENPLSEIAAWINVGLDWTPVVTNGSIAYGTSQYGLQRLLLTSPGSPRTVDPGTVFSTGSFTENQEIELHLRWGDSPHLARRYEMIEANNRYGTITR